MKGISLLITILLLIGLIVAVPSSYLTKEDSDNIVDSILNTQSESGLFNDNLKDTFHAVESLSILERQIPKRDAICNSLKRAQYKDVEDAFYGLSVRKTLSCEGTANVQYLIKEGLEKKDLINVVYSILSASISGFNDEKLLKKAGNFLKNLQDSEYGSFFLNEKQERSSPYYAGLAFSAFAKVFRYMEVEEQQSVTELLGELLETGEENEEGLFFSHSDNSISNLKTSSFLLDGLVDLAEFSEDIKSSVSDVQVNQLASYIITQKYISTLEETYSLLNGLSAANRGVFKKPLVLSLINTVVYPSSKNDDDVKVQLTDLFGAPAKDKNRVYVHKAYPFGAEESALLSLRNQEIPVLKGNTYSLNFLAARPDPGTYILDFSVTTGEEYLKIESAKRKVIVVVRSEITDTEIAVSDYSDFADISKTTVSPGKEVKINAKENQFLYVSFKIRNSVSNRPLNVHQAVLKLTGPDGEEYYFVAKASNTRVYSVVVDLSQNRDLFANKSGSYEINLIVGDSYIEKSSIWKLGQVTITFASTESRKPVDPFAKKNEIIHAFRKAEIEAEPIFTQLFSALLFAPAGYFVIQTLRVGNLRGIPTDSTFMYSVVFIGSIGLLFALNIYYWLYLRFLQALYYIVLVGLVAVFSGNKVLRYLARKRKTHTD